MSICRNPKCMGYCAECPKVHLASDSRHVVTDGRTYYDLDAELRIRDAERKVVEAAKAWDNAWYIASVDDHGIGPTPLERCTRELYALSDAVRALDAAEGTNA